MGYLNLSGLSHFLDKLKLTFADINHVEQWDSVSDVTIGGVTYHTYWEVTPTGSNDVYGVALHPTTGKLMRIHNDNGTSTAEDYWGAKYSTDIAMSNSDSTTAYAAINARVKTINGRSPDQNGNITVIEGGGGASIALLEVDATIATTDWVSSNGSWVATLTNSSITANMTGVDCWLTTPDPILDEAVFATSAGSLTITVTNKPSSAWDLHLLIGENGSVVLSDITQIQNDVSALQTGKTPIPKIVTLNNGNNITAAGTYSITVSNVDDYWRPVEIVLSDQSAVLEKWTWSVSSDGVVSLTVPSGGIKSTGTAVKFILAQTNNNI